LHACWHTAIRRRPDVKEGTPGPWLHDPDDVRTNVDVRGKLLDTVQAERGDPDEVKRIEWLGG
jgi:hypothetical protein